MIPQTVVCGTLGGIRWRAARELLTTLGVEIQPAGPRRWFIRAADWEQVKRRLGLATAAGAA